MTITSNTVAINLQSQQSCPCGQIWDSVLGQCSALIPASVSGNLDNLDVYYACNHTNLHSWASSQDARCTASDAVYEMSISGTVTDSDGHPICGQQVVLSPNNSGSYEVPISYQEVFGVVPFGITVTWYVQVIAPNAITTDQNGDFSTSLLVLMSVASSSTAVPAIPSCYEGSLGTIPVIVTLSVLGTDIANVTSGTIYLYTADVGATI